MLGSKMCSIVKLEPNGEQTFPPFLLKHDHCALLSHPSLQIHFASSALAVWRPMAAAKWPQVTSEYEVKMSAHTNTH